MLAGASAVPATDCSRAQHAADKVPSGLPRSTQRSIAVAREEGSAVYTKAEECSIKQQPQTLNGFKSVPEPEAVRVSPEHIAPYTQPEEAFTFKPTSSGLIASFSNGDSERLIHCNVELNSSELKTLKKLQDLARRQGKAFMPSITSAATRYLSDSRDDHEKALTKMQATQDWRMEYFGRGGPISDERVMEDMKLGIIYISGRDSSLRPAIIVRPSRIPQAWYDAEDLDRFVRLVIFCLEYFLRYMVIPGRVESNVVICDLAGLSLSHVPLKALRAVHQILTGHYLGRNFRIYICNMPWVFKAIATIAIAILSDRQQQKLVFVGSDFQELRRDFAPHQLESDFGGTHPPFCDFYPFPLLPGPFGQKAKGPHQDAEPNLHEALDATGVRGRIWDPAASAATNTRLELARGEAVERLLQCCPELRSVAAVGEEPRPIAEGDLAAGVPTGGKHIDFVEPAGTSTGMLGFDEDGMEAFKACRDDGPDDHVMEDVQVIPACGGLFDGLFSCHCQVGGPNHSQKFVCL
eukprot:gnl/TRDRNA2_/TRDRNA2_157289_c0_seq1.p1 gnl/TRDRNA2_/TRDRNA2_157289_c0~~gnl/TRDRNA2_/TRDRNA2_157289_c0_seq1.p1  ORF type:complete len:612 (-),score=88.95 gnl/TRDRNA2_/TRDRNA2_157289_c0_seq1:240-1805(-)